MNAATQQEYDSLRADLDRLRDLVDRTNGRLTTLAAKVSDSPARNALVSRGLAKWLGDGQTVQITDAGVALVAQNLSTDSTDGHRFKAPNKSVQSA